MRFPGGSLVLVRAGRSPVRGCSAAGRVGPGDGGVGAAGQRQDDAAGSWISQAGLGDCAAWVATGREERDPQRFWLSVLGALRLTAPGSALVQALTAAPDLDGWAIAERLLADLAPLEDRIWLVIDDVHELGPEALRQLELLLMRAPPGCGSCWPPGMTCGWGCTGCGWRAS